MADRKKESLQIQVGNFVQYQDLDGAVVESIIVGVVRGDGARVVGFYPEKKSPVEPRIAVTIDRIIKVWPSESND